MLTIAGSGPSCRDYNGVVTVATKKQSLPSEYVYCHYPFQHKMGRLWLHDRSLNRHYTPFIRSKRPPQRMKASLGLCAVLGVVDRWNPDEIGLIGFDNILDGNEEWGHDAIAERACIESLVKIVDLRQGS